MHLTLASCTNVNKIHFAFFAALRMATKVTAVMVTLRIFIVVICVCCAGLTDSAPTELSEGTGAYPRVTKDLPSSNDDAKQWLPQKPAARSKHTTKLSLQKKPIKDKASWTKMQTAAGGGGKAAKIPYSPTLVSTGYDLEKDNLSRNHPHHREAGAIATVVGNILGGGASAGAGSDILVDNVDGPKGYTNKLSSNSSTPQPTTRLVYPTADDDDDSGKDIDFISVARTTKADETYATEPGHDPAKGEALDAEAIAIATTIRAGLVENPNFNADLMARMSTKTTASHTDDNAAVRDIKSITPAASTTPTTPAHTMTAPSVRAKSLPVNASLSPSLSSVSSQHSATASASATPTTTAKMTFTGTTTTTSSSISRGNSTVPSKIDVGHDGVKVTKKKQLFDKHFIGPSIAGHVSLNRASGSLQPPMADGNSSRPLSKNKPTPAKSEKKLIEVPNGYLGPIMMKEKTFSVSHHGGKKPKPSIVEQLRDKKLVEIIAPTALMEPTMKVKSSIPPAPEFVAIESVSATTTTTTTSTSTPPPMVPPTSATTKEEEDVESETATTYFLVVTQNSEDADAKPTTAEPAVGLKEIYAEALNAMEEASKKNKPTTEIAVANWSPSTDRPSTGTQTEQTLTTLADAVTSEGVDPQQSTQIDHVLPATHSSPSSAGGDPQDITYTLPNTAILSTASDSPGHQSPLVAEHLMPTDVKQIQIHGTTQRIADDRLSSTTDRAVQTTEMQRPTEPTPSLTTTDSSMIKEHASDARPKIVDHPAADGPPLSATTISDRTSDAPPTSSSNIDSSTTTTERIGHDATPTTIEPIITSSPVIQHDSSARTASTVSPTIVSTTTTDRNPTSATITTDAFPSVSTTHQQLPLKPTHDSEQTESKISDIQIEVYDSTVESILASTNFKENSEAFYPSTHVTTKQSPSNMNSAYQERFTQYVVDKATDFATQESNSVAKAPGKPEPAAIEIHINVSEGFGNESEDLEFSYRQSDYRKLGSKKAAGSNFITLKPFEVVPQNETSNEAAEEIVVEIIDGNTNSTENSASRENLNVNPIFTFRSDDDSQVELKNVKYYPEDRPKEAAKVTDDFFVPDIAPEPPGIRKPIMDRDSDTIFYISNTEVKVGESLPTTNTYDAQLKRTRLENQFFPADYEERKKAAPQRYEEDIILSPLKNRNSDPLKLVRGPLDITYVGESVMEVEQAPITTTIPPPVPGSTTPDVIIQPAILPEMAIGVPVIGELPPQIELKEIEFMPNFDANKEDSSIQYGGDLIDEGGAMGAGFDMDSYPLGNLGLGQRHDAISSQAVFNHHVNHFKKDELSADLAASSETADANDLLRRSNDSANGTIIGERMGNATAYSVMEEPPSADGEIHFTDLQTLFTACLATLLPLVLSVVMAFGLRHLYRKYQTNSFSVMGHNSSTDPLDAEKGNSGDGSADGDDDAQTPDEDISRNARETKMHYNNSEKDGVFVVEVSRGADSKIMPGSPVGEPGDKCPFNLNSSVCINQTSDDKTLSCNEEVQVHPPPPESAGIPVDIDSNHLHQIDEVDEFEEGLKNTKHSNTGLSQSDLSSSSSVDSNKRYSYGNQELYTIEQQDYNTPSPAATRAPHSHAEAQVTQPENHNDDNGHPGNGHCLENDHHSAPNSDAINPVDTDSVVNGHSVVESKPKITAALLKQDTVIVNDMTNGVGHNGNDNGNGNGDDGEDEPSPHNSIDNLHNSVAPNIKTDTSIVDYGGDTENGFDSIISLPDPPSTEEMKQMNDIILMETNQLDSLPPPPPPAGENHSQHNGNGNCHTETENGDSHSIGSSASPMPTPTKVMTAPAPPTVTVAAASSATADIPHSNGNCMTGHTTAASTAAVVEVSGSS